MTDNETSSTPVPRRAFTLAEAFASIAPLRTPEDWEQRIREAKDAKAERDIRKLARQERDRARFLLS